MVDVLPLKAYARERLPPTSLLRSIFYAMRLVYVKARGVGYVAIDESEDGELDLSSRLAWLDSASLSTILRPIVVV